MATSREDIRTWLEAGKKQGATHLVVVVDTWDYEDFPVYVLPGQDVREIAAKNSNYQNMSRVMEVYALHLDFDSQLNEYRSFHYEDPPPEDLDKTIKRAHKSIKDLVKAANKAHKTKKRVSAKTKSRTKIKSKSKNKV